jgi:hypothetical protein
MRQAGQEPRPTQEPHHQPGIHMKISDMNQLIYLITIVTLLPNSLICAMPQVRLDQEEAPNIVVFLADD